MNRGRGRQAIFHNEAYYQTFLETIKEASSRFGMEVMLTASCGINTTWRIRESTKVDGIVFK